MLAQQAPRRANDVGSGAGYISNGGSSVPTVTVVSGPSGAGSSGSALPVAECAPPGAMAAGGTNSSALPTATPIQYMGQTGAPVAMQGGRVVHMGAMPMHAFGAGNVPGQGPYMHPGMHPGMRPGTHGHGGVSFYGPQAR